MLRALAVLAVLCALPGSAGADPLRVLVWPARADTDTSGALGEVRAAGYELVSFEPIRKRLAARGSEARGSETKALKTAAKALETARTAYVEQRFDDMASALEGLDKNSLAVLALPRHKDTFWEIQFQRGLAELSRSDATQAARRFALAMAVDESRSPRRELYGPEVSRAFAEAADARAAAPARAVDIEVQPPDARVIVDGTPVVDLSRPRSLRPGLHAVVASAPGFATEATLIDIGETGKLRLELSRASGDAVDRIGAAWALGELSVSRASGLDAIAEVVRDLGVTAALAIDVASDGSGVARVVTMSESSPAIRRATTAKAAKAALARLLPSGKIGSGDDKIAPSPRQRDDSTVFSTWWFWTVAGTAAVAITVIGIVVLSPEDKIQIVPPRP